MDRARQRASRQGLRGGRASERWLRLNDLPLDTLMDSTQKGDFLTESKDQYHSRPEQKRLQERDAQEEKNHA